MTVKMNEDGLTASFHHAIGGYRRIDAAGQEARHLPRHSDRQAARSLKPLPIVIGARAHDLDVNCQLRVAQDDLRSGALHDGGADDAVHVHRRQGIAFIGALGGDPEGMKR